MKRSVELIALILFVAGISFVLAAKEKQSHAVEAAEVSGTNQPLFRKLHHACAREISFMATKKHKKQP